MAHGSRCEAASAAKAWPGRVAAVAVSAMRYGESPALSDERGTLSYSDLERRSNALFTAPRWPRCRRRPLWLLCRIIAASRWRPAEPKRCSCLLMNTGFGVAVSGCRGARKVTAIIYDEELIELLSALPAGIDRYLAWQEDPAAASTVIDRSDDQLDDTARFPPVVWVARAYQRDNRHLRAPLKPVCHWPQRFSWSGFHGRRESVLTPADLPRNGFSQFIIAFAIGAKIVPAGA